MCLFSRVLLTGIPVMFIRLVHAHSWDKGQAHSWDKGQAHNWDKGHAQTPLLT